jgi:hypothetical protein
MIGAPCGSSLAWNVLLGKPSAIGWRRVNISVKSKDIANSPDKPVKLFLALARVVREVYSRLLDQQHCKLGINFL